MDRGSWWATIHEVAKSRTQLSDLTQHTLCNYKAVVTLLELLLSHFIVSNKIILGVSRPFYSLEKKMCKVFLSLNLEVFAAAAVAKLLQLCLTVCDPIDGSPPVSSVLGILQSRILESLVPLNSHT